MFLGLVGIAVAVNSLWVILGLGLWYPVMRYGVIGREEAYIWSASSARNISPTNPASAAGFNIRHLTLSLSKGEA